MNYRQLIKILLPVSTTSDDLWHDVRSIKTNRGGHVPAKSTSNTTSITQLPIKTSYCQRMLSTLCCYLQEVAILAWPYQNTDSIHFLFITCSNSGCLFLTKFQTMSWQIDLNTQVQAVFSILRSVWCHKEGFTWYGHFTQAPPTLLKGSRYYGSDQT